MNHLYFGDCLDILKQLKDENPQPFIDLIYIDAGHIKIGDVEFPQDKIQILTIEDLFDDKKPQLPFSSDNTTFKKAQRNENKSVSKGLFD